MLAKKGGLVGFATVFDDDDLFEKNFTPEPSLEITTAGNFFNQYNKFVYFPEKDIAVSNTAASMVMYGNNIACYPGLGEKREGRCGTCTKALDPELCTECITEKEKLQDDGTCLHITIDIIKQWQVVLESSVTYIANETSIATFSEAIDPTFNVSRLKIETAPVAKNTDPLSEYNTRRRRRRILNTIGSDNTLETLIFKNLTLKGNQIILEMDTSFMDSDFKSAIKLNVSPDLVDGADKDSDPSVMFSADKTKAFWYFPLYFPSFNYSLADSYKSESSFANRISLAGLWIGSPMILIVSGRGF